MFRSFEIEIYYLDVLKSKFANVVVDFSSSTLHTNDNYRRRGTTQIFEQQSVTYYNTSSRSAGRGLKYQSTCSFVTPDKVAGSHFGFWSLSFNTATKEKESSIIPISY